MEYLFDEPCSHQLVDLLAYGSALFFVESAQRLLHGQAPARISSECSATSLGMPGMSEGLHANLGVRAEKVDEHCFLFGVELGAGPDLLGGVVAGVERDGLNRL
jgi:hypothetical protein